MLSNPKNLIAGIVLRLVSNFRFISSALPLGFRIGEFSESGDWSNTYTKFFSRIVVSVTRRMPVYCRNGEPILCGATVLFSCVGQICVIILELLDSSSWWPWSRTTRTYEEQFLSGRRDKSLGFVLGWYESIRSVFVFTSRYWEGCALLSSSHWYTYIWLPVMCPSQFSFSRRDKRFSWNSSLRVSICWTFSGFGTKFEANLQG